MVFEITSSAFENEGTIPNKYSCFGDNVSPPLAWSDPPAGTESFVLIVEDADAIHGPETNWIVFGLPGDTRGLPEAVTSVEDLPEGAMLGENGMGLTGFDPPCPQTGTHRYFYRLYALDTTPALTLGATREEIDEAMDGHILDVAELMGTCSSE